MTPSGRDPFGHDQRRAARSGRSGRRSAAAPAATLPPLPSTYFSIDVGRALADLPAVEIDAGHPRLRGERDEHRVLVPPGRGRECRTSPSPARRSNGLRAFRRPATTAARRRPVPASVTPGSGTNSVACRLPSVIVPVLSSSSVCTSPAASTARPDMARTLCCTSRSMPAMPIAESSPPIVVGIRHTSSDDQHETGLVGAFA